MKEKILTMSFDDCEDYDRRLCDLLRKYGIKSTFFIISNQLSWVWEDYKRYGETTTIRRVSAEEIPTTYKGMEIASHTCDHRCSVKDLDETVVKSANDLKKLCGYDVCGLAYPGGEYTHELSQALKEKGIKYARTIRCTKNFSLPENWLEWHPTCHYADADAMRLADEFLNYNGDETLLFNMYGHSYELTENLPDRNWEYFENLLKKLAGRSDVKYMTNIEVYKHFNKN